MKKWLGICVIGLVLCTGCSRKDAQQETNQTIESQTQSTTMTEVQQESELVSQTEVETESSTGPEIVEITISVAGDCTLGTNQEQGYAGSFHEYYDKYGKDYFFRQVQSVIGTDDFTLMNCEGTFTESEEKADKKWNHKGRPEYASIFVDSSVEAVALMNNHIMDYGVVGRDDTIYHLKEAGVGYAMSGEGIYEMGIYETEKGIKIGYVSLAWGSDLVTLQGYVEKLKAQGAAICVAYMHWGMNYKYEIQEDQDRLGHLAVDAGFDMIVGCHPHVLNGIEIYKGKYIVYSLGNFCYGGSMNPKDKDSMIWQETFTFIDGVKQEGSRAKVIPCWLSSVQERNDYCPVILDGEEKSIWLSHMNEYCKPFSTYVNEQGELLPVE